MSKSEVERGRESERRTETALPARGLSGLQAAEQWQETSAWNFSLRAGMRAPYPGSRGPRAALRSTETSLSVGSSGQGWPPTGGWMYIDTFNDRKFSSAN